jgi:hypothetical protein
MTCSFKSVNLFVRCYLNFEFIQDCEWDRVNVNVNANDANANANTNANDANANGPLLNAIFLKNAISFRQGSIFASANSLHRQKT